MSCNIDLHVVEDTHAAEAGEGFEDGQASGDDEASKLNSSDASGEVLGREHEQSDRDQDEIESAGGLHGIGHGSVVDDVPMDIDEGVQPGMDQHEEEDAGMGFCESTCVTC